MTTHAHTLRAARPHDAAQIANLFQLVYAESSHPCKSLEFVAHTLRRRRADVWHVSALCDRITACMGTLPHRWNRSWEIVRGVTHPEFRGSGLATELAQRAIDDAWASDDCDLVVVFPRSRTIYRILAEMVTPGFTLTGHDGGLNIAGGRREYHLVALSFARHKNLARVEPAKTIPFVKASRVRRTRRIV
jgi:GNAT superfamily N-acetyltransferase